MLKKILIQLSGFFIVAFGIVGIVFSRLGASPIDAFNYFMYTITPLSLGTLTVLSGFLVAMICFVIERKWSILFSILFLMTVGIFVDFWKFIFDGLPQVWFENYLIRIPLAAFSLLMITIGVALTITTGLIMAPYEQLMLIIDRKVHNLGLSKMMIEGTFLIFAVVLGIYTKQLWDQVFVMTLVIALVNGPLSHFFVKKIIKRREVITYETK
ncbi:MAG: hypothetical protein RBQ71_07175 [Acholeplasmataceae bacterium]|nr:hypothetical protein [Acholeplasmataceae bacterium]